MPISRRRLRELVDKWALRLDEDCDTALATVISELVSNAVRHSSGAMLTVGVHANLDLRRLLLEVYDGSVVLPQARVVGLDSEAGRGMLLVDRLSLSHGAERTERGKRVWAELGIPEQPLTRRQLILHPRRAARAVARRLSAPRRPPIHPPTLAASRPC
ncbi:ATP-binding protein [Kitasatospora kifunensis]|uniref:Two-component sensor histidine kinase n=1 Tax=Kitasatospora kifunensis TaxID=58351 RepID=A0A7W7R2S2_KITKI|nr:ATP-binding protein [Kitasatospora kifunensis]MBB4924355.1 two-component sensor histidine kinase [Kitasatospora kifunensis]